MIWIAKIVDNLCMFLLLVSVFSLITGIASWDLSIAAPSAALVCVFLVAYCACAVGGVLD